MHYFTWKLVCLKYFVHDCLWKQLFAFNVTKAPSDLTFFTIFVTSMPLTKFKLKIRTTNLQRKARFCLSWYFSDLFTVDQICYWKPFKLGLGCSLRKVKYILAKIWLFLTTGVVNKGIKCKRKFCRHLCA